MKKRLNPVKAQQAERVVSTGHWNRQVNELMKEYGVTEAGLTNKQAEQIRQKTGANVLCEEKKKNIIEVFLSQFCDLLVIILIIAAIISMASNNSGSAIVILLVLVMNATIGTIQHIKTEKSLDSLKKMSAPTTRVMRDGVIQEIPSMDIVPGDICVLEAGDLISADGRIIHSYSLQVNESSLTGESAAVEKYDHALTGKVALADQINMVHSGCLVIYGRAEVLVTETGMNTEMGRIAGMMNETKEKKTPLQVSLDAFSSKLATLIIVICAIVFALCQYRKMPFMDSLMFAIALAVAAIPEALGSIVTIVQAIGTQKMAKANAIIKDLKAVESLGCVSVICTDKTGTLTQNKMTVQKIYTGNQVLLPKQLNMTNHLHKYLIYNAVLNNDSCITDGKGVGDPTEYALLEMFRSIPHQKGLAKGKADWDENLLRNAYERLEEIPFDSDRKRMSSKYCIDDKNTILTKGALDMLLGRCDRIYDAGGIRRITQSDLDQISRQNMIFAEQALRVLAFAYKETDQSLTLEEENHMIFLGMVAMMDPPRPESVEAVKNAKHAGIKPIMITGDHKETAKAIARQIGIFSEHDLSVTGMELDAMSEEVLDQKLERITVYARVSPENKIRIVDAWQRKGKVVAMTGDGINDAPALKKSDIGVAMGITGTEVSKDASSMILSDDNFATIIQAVINGRNVYRNIKNAILFLLSGNMAGILCVLYVSILGLPIPFTAVQLLFINLLTDSLPAIAIGMEPLDPSLLDEKPRDPKEGILTKQFFLQLLGQGLLIAITVMISYHLGLRESAMMASTMAFSTLTIARLFHGFNCRGKKSIAKLGLASNKYSIYAFIGGLVLIYSVLLIPLLHPVFFITDVTWKNVFTLMVLAFLPTFIIQEVKMCLEKHQEKMHKKNQLSESNQSDKKMKFDEVQIEKMEKKDE